MLKKLLSFLAVFTFTITLSFSHSSQVRWCVDPSGNNLRVYIEHWHGDLTTFSAASTIDLSVSVNGGAPSTQTGVLPAGAFINTPFASLPCQGGSSNLIAQGTCANNYNDWGYWDVPINNLGICDNDNPPISIAVTVDNPANAVFFGGCGLTYPQTALASQNAPDCPPCDITSFSLTPGPCNQADQTFNAAITIDGVNFPDMGDLNVDIWNDGIIDQTLSAPFTTPINLNVPIKFRCDRAAVVALAFTDDSVCATVQAFAITPTTDCFVDCETNACADETTATLPTDPEATTMAGFSHRYILADLSGAVQAINTTPTYNPNALGVGSYVQYGVNYPNSESGTILGTTDINDLLNRVSPGDYTVTCPLCTLVVNPQPATPTAINTTICEGDLIAMADWATQGMESMCSNPTNMLVSWHDASTGGTQLAYDFPAWMPTGHQAFAPGVYTYYAQCNDTSTNCSSQRVAVNLTVNGATSSPTVPNYDICQNEAPPSVVITGTAPTSVFNIYNGTSVLLESSVTSPNLGSYAAADFDNSTPGTYNFFVTEVTTTSTGADNPGTLVCEGDAAAFSVVVNTPPITPAPSVMGTVCDGDNAQLTTGPVPGGTYAWYAFNTPSLNTLVSTNQNPVISGLAVGMHSFWLQVTDANGCNSDSAEVVVTVHPEPVATLPASYEFCGGDDVTFAPDPASGGTPGYTYSWTGPGGYMSTQATPTITNVQPSDAGSYSVTITDANGCISNTASTNLNVMPVPGSGVVNSNGPICEGDNLILSSTAYSHPSVTYTWTGPSGPIVNNSPNLTIPNAVLADGGVYTVSVTFGGASSCAPETFNTNAIVNPNPVDPAPTSNNPNCEGDDLMLTASGAAGDAYVWSGPNGFASNQQNPTITAATPAANGTYIVTVTTPAGCSGMGSVTVSSISPTPVTPTLTTNGPICAGEDLIITATPVSGATYNYTFNGAPFSTSTSNVLVISNPVTANTGTYGVSVNVGGCVSGSSSVFATVNDQPGDPMATAVATPACEGGDIFLTAQGAGTYSYSWTGPNGYMSIVQNPVINNITVANNGTYIVTVTAPGGCTSQSSVVMSAIQPTPDDPTISLDNDVICEGGEIILLSNSVAGATYEWLFNGAPLTTTSVATTTISPATAADGGIYGVYHVVNGCPSDTQYITVTVGAIPAPPVIITESPVCDGDFIILTTTSTADTYTWTGPNGYMSNAQNPPAVVASVLTAGTYNLEITNNGCASSAFTNIVVNPSPDKPTLTSSAPQCEDDLLTLITSAACDSIIWVSPIGTSPATLAANPSLTTIGGNNTNIAPGTNPYQSGLWSLICYDNGCGSESDQVQIDIFPFPSAPIAANSGPVCEGDDVTLSTAIVANATYKWYTDAGLTLPSLFSNQQNPVLSGLTAGTYTYYVTVTVNNCESPAGSTTVTINANPIVTLPSSYTDCGGLGNDVTFNYAAPTGGLAPYNYVWSGPNGYSSTAQNPTITGITSSDAGSYSLMVTDANGCSDTAVTQLIVNPTPGATVMTSNAPICAGDVLTISSTSFSNPGTTYSWTGPSGAITNNSPILTIANATTADGGMYTVSVTFPAATGCPNATASITVVVNAIPVDPAPTATPPNCAGGTLSLTATGLASNSYAWSGPNAWTSTMQNPMIPNVDATWNGTYNVVVTGVGGCTSNNSVTVSSINNNPSLPMISNNGPVCEGDNLTVSTNAVTGGTYHFLFNGAALVSSTNAIYSVASAAIADGGIYGVYHEVNGCVSDTVFTTAVVNAQPVDPAPTATPPNCAGGTLSLTATGLATDTYNWSGPNAWTSTMQNPMIPNVDATWNGTYSVVVTGAGGCTSTNSVTVSSINNNPSLPLISNNGPVCEGDNLTISTNAVTGGTYHFLFGGAVISSSTNAIYSILAATVADGGTYGVYHEVNGCVSDTVFTTAVVNAIPTAPIVANNGPVCEGSVITLTSTTTADSYLWSGPNGFTSTLQNPTSISNATASDAGLYTLTITINGCSSSASTTVLITPKPNTPTITSNSPICDGETLTMSTSAACDSFYWVGPMGGSAGTLSGNVGLITTTGTTSFNQGDVPYQGGNWSVICWSNGCSSDASPSINVVINNIPAAPVATNNGPVCEGGSITLSTSSVVGATYTWYEDATLTTVMSNMQNPVLSGLAAGTYTYYVTVTVNNCESPAGSTMVTINANPVVTLPSSYTDCGGLGNDVTFNYAAPTGGLAPYNYVWSGPNGYSSTAQNPTMTGITSSDAGSYTLMVTDANGCSDTAVTQLIVNPTPGATVMTSNAPICAGDVLTISSTSFSNPGTTYSWTGPSGAITNNSPILTIANATTADGGMYTVSVTFPAATGCPNATASITVVVNAIPVDPAPTATPPNCAGGTLSLTATGLASNSYAWSGPNAWTSTMQNPMIPNVDATWNGTYNVVVTGVGGCTSNNSVTVSSINNNPSLPMISNNGPVCEGDNLTVSTNAVTGGTYHFLFNGAALVSSTNAIYSVASAAIADGGIYGVYHEVNGCVSDTVFTTAVVNAQPVDPAPTATPPNCAGGTLSLTATGLATDTYNWSGPNAWTSTMQNPTIPNVDATWNGTYTVLVTGAGGCTSTNSVTVSSVNNNPALPMISDNGPVCVGDNLTITTNAVTGGTYHFLFNGAALVSSTNAIFSVASSTIADGGIYGVYHEVNGCVSDTVFTTAVVNAQPVEPAPTATPPNCAGGTLSLTATGLATDTYNWSGPNAWTSTMQNPTIPNVDATWNGTYTVIVTGAGGCTSNNSVTVSSINNNPVLPTITNNGPVCEGDNLVITTNAVTGGTYHFLFGGAVISTSNNAILSIPAATVADGGTFGVYHEVNGCVSDTVFTTAVVNAIPTAPIVVNNGPVCEGSVLTLTSTTTADSYLWNGPNGFTSTLQNPNSITNATASDAGLYTLTITTNGCSSSASTTVLITPKPNTPTITSNSPICDGEILTMSTSAACDSFYWVGPMGGSAGTLSGNAGLITTTGTTSINQGDAPYQGGNWSVICWSNGCSSDASPAINVVINNIPAAPVANNSGPVCEGGSITLSTSSVVGATYTWYEDATLTTVMSNMQNPVLNSLTAGTYTYYVTLTINNCESPADSTLVTINANPVVTLPSSYSDCAGSGNDVTFNYAAPTGGVAPYSYFWTGPNSYNSTAQNPTITNVQSSDAGSYTLMVTDANGCSDTAVTQLIVNPTPGSTVMTSNAPICAGDVLTISSTAYTNPGTTYSWTGPSGVITNNSPVLTIPNATTADGGMYTVSVTFPAATGCANATASITVVVNPQPINPAPTAAASSCEGGRIILNATGLPTDNYTWSGPNGWSSNMQNPIINNIDITWNGTYTVVVTGVGGCTSTNSVTVSNINANPVLPLISNNGPVCEGDNLIISTNAVTGGTYHFLFNGAALVSSTNAIYNVASAAITDDGIYGVYHEVNGCLSDTVYTTVIVNAQPVDPAPSATPPNCAGGTLSLTATGLATDTYNWSGPNAWTSTLQNPSIANVNATWNGTYTVVVTAAGGCSATNSVTVTSINNNPALPLISNNSPVCEGANLIISTNAVTGGTYHFLFNGAALVSSTNAIYNVASAAITDGGIYGVYHEVNGCVSDTVYTTAVVNAQPADPAPTATPPNCAGGTLSLTAAGLTTNTYNWSGPNGWTSTLQNPTIPNVDATWNGTYTVVVNAVGGCMSTNSVNVSSINDNPPLPIISNNTPVCEGDNFSVTTNLITGGTYHFLFNGAALVSSTNATYNVASATIADGGTYGVYHEVNGCVSDTVYTIAIVNAIPAAPVVANNGPVCEGSVLTLSSTTTANSYLWNGPNGFTSTLQNPTSIANATLSDAGLYTLTITTNGCSSSASTTVVITPKPNTPTITSNSPICDGETLIMSTSAACDSFYWVGPMGSSSSTLSGNAGLITTTGTTSFNTGDAPYQGGNWSVICWSNGCSSNASAPINVTINNIPSIPLASNSGPVCDGGSVTLSTSTITGATYTWYDMSGVYSNQQNPTVSGLAPGMYTYGVVVNANGCLSDTGFTTITIYSNPTATLPDSLFACGGVGTNLTMPNAANGGMPPYTYAWTGPQGFNSAAATPILPNVSVTSQGSYTVVVTDANGCVSNAASITLVIRNTPSATYLTSNAPICEGGVLTISSVAFGDPGVTYNWTFNNGSGFVSIPNNAPTLTYNPADPSNSGVYAVNVTFPAASGCPPATDTINVQVLAAPMAPAPSNSGYYCSGDAIQLMANPPAGTYTYSWTGPNGFTSTQQNPVITNSMVSNAGTYAVTISNALNCSSTGITQVDVRQNPAKPVINGTNVYCENDRLVLFTNSYAGSNVTYNWLLNGTSLGVNSNFFIVNNVTAANNGNYQLVVSVDGCTSDTSIVYPVTINAIPLAPTPSNSGWYCSGDVIQLFANSSFGGGTFAWTGPNGFTSNLENPTITNASTLNSGYYTVTVSNGNCTATGNTQVDVRLNPSTPNITSNSPICEGDNLVLTTGNYNGISVSYAWYDQSGALLATTNVGSYTIPSAGAAQNQNYTVIVTVDSCVSQSSTPTTVVVTAMPAAPVINQNGPVCSGDFITLTTPTVAGNYYWTGPNGFTSSQQNPTAIAASAVSAGTYNLRVENNGCTSITSSTIVTVRNKPLAPVVTNNGPICDGINLVLTSNTSCDSLMWIAPGGIQGLPALTTMGNTLTINAGNALYLSGQWSVVCYSNGCASDASLASNVVINSIPTAPSISNNGPKCEGENMQLTSANVNGAQYNWSGPNGYTSNLPNPLLSGVTLAQAGVYNLTVTVNGCTSLAQSTTVVVNATPAVPVITNSGPYCEGATIQLSTTAVAGTYSWTGPNGFTSNLQNPSIPGATALEAGNYTLTVTTNGCSATSSVSKVIITSLPNVPTITSNAPICSGDDLVLNSTVYQGLSVSYFWYKDGVVFDTTATSQLIIDSALVNGTGNYTVQVTINGCTSSLSASTSITVNALPATPVISSNSPVCEGEALQLQVISPTSANQYIWTGPNGFTSNNQQPTVVSSASLSDAGTYFLKVVINGCESEVAQVTVVVNETPATPLIFSNSPICDGDSLILTTNASATSYIWKNPDGTTTTTVDSFLIIFPATTSNAGNYSLQVSSNGCISDASLNEEVIVNDILSENAFAGSNQVVCADAIAAILSATASAGGNGFWTALNGGTITSPNTAMTTVTDLSPGNTYSFVWTIGNGACSNSSTDTMEVYMAIAPKAFDDQYYVDENGRVELATVLENDSLYGFGNATVTITTQPENGTASVNMDGSISYIQTGSFVSHDSLEYTICYDECPNSCSTAWMRVYNYLFIPDIFTPAGNNGANDVFTIMGIENFPNNNLKVYNRWGNIVYNSEGNYQNNWAGTWESEDLPEGTYFYIFDNPNTGEVYATGYITLQR